MENVMRYQFADYLNTSNTSEAEYNLMNTGFTSLGENPNTQEETKQYVGDKSSSSTVFISSSFSSSGITIGSIMGGSAAINIST